MSLAILFHFLCAQHVSKINMSLIRSLGLFCWITTLVVFFFVRCVLECRCGWVGVVSVLQAEAQLHLLLYFTSYMLNMFRTLIYPSSVVSVLQAEACNTDTTPNQPHRNSDTHRTKNNTTNVVFQQNSHKFLMMDILMSETCWAHKKWNNVTSEVVLQPTTRIPLQTNHTETPTHIEPRTIRPMW